MNSRNRVIAGLAVVAALGVGTAVAEAAVTDNVKLSDFKVTPSRTTISHGKVTFNVKNSSGMEHELVVIKTNTKASKLKVVGGKASEKGSVGEVELAGHKTKKLTLNLKKGHYALICNVGGHYMAGMHADLTVK